MNRSTKFDLPNGDPTCGKGSSSPNQQPAGGKSFAHPAAQSNAVLDALSAHICVLDSDGKILAVNKAWRDFALANGFKPKNSRKSANYLSVCDAVSGPDAPLATEFAAAIRDVIHGKRDTFSIEYPCHSRTEERWFVGRITRLSGTIPSQVVVCHENITERKKAEMALLESREQYRQLVEKAPDGILQLDPQGNFIFANPTLCRMLGYTQEELLQLTILDTYPEREKGTGHQRIGAIAHEGHKQFERTMVRKDGSTISVNVSAIKLPNGRLQAIVQDITERKKAEAALRESNEILSQFIQHSPIHAFIKTVTPTESRVLKASENFQDMVGIPGSQLTGKPMHELFSPEFAAKITADDWSVVSTGKAVELDEDLNGRHYLTVKFPIALGGEKLLAGYSIDITARKQAEEAFRQASQFNAEIISGAMEGIIVYDHSFRYLVWNHFMEYLTGLQAAEVLGKVAFDLFPHLREQGIDKLLKRALEGETVSATDMHYHVPRTGRTGWTSATYGPHRDASGNIIGVIGTVREITERKQAEHALQASETRFRTLIEKAPVAVGISRDGTTVYVNGKYLDLFRFKSMGQLVGQPICQQWAPEFRHMIEDRARRRSRGEPVTSDYEGVGQRSDGSQFPMHVAVATVDLPDGPASLAFLTDITEQKQAQEELRKKDEFLRLVTETIDDVVWMSSAESEKIIYISPAYERVWGQTCESLYANPRSYFDKIHPEDRQTLLQALEQFHRRGRPYSTEYRIISPDGTLRWIRDRGYPVLDDRKRLRFMAGICSDITESKNAEQTLHEMSQQLLQVEDEERRRIARELHDSTAQKLAGLMMTLCRLEKTAAAPSHRELLKDAQALAEESTRELRTISHLLHPPLLDELGFKVALDAYITGFSKRSGIKVKVKLCRCLNQLQTRDELVLFRVVQEGLGNIHRHSGSRSANIEFSYTTKAIVLEIRDSGHGISKDKLEKLRQHPSAEGVGVAGMQQRLRNIGGSLEIESSSCGTIIRATLPRQRPWARNQ